MHIDILWVTVAVLTAENLQVTTSKGVSMKTVETPLDPPQLVSSIPPNNAKQVCPHSGVFTCIRIILYWSPTALASIVLWPRLLFCQSPVLWTQVPLTLSPDTPLGADVHVHSLPFCREVVSYLPLSLCLTLSCPRAPASLPSTGDVVRGTLAPSPAPWTLH